MMWLDRGLVGWLAGTIKEGLTDGDWEWECERWWWMESGEDGKSGDEVLSSSGWTSDT